MKADSDDLSASVERLRSDYRLLVEKLESNQRDFRRLARSVYRVQEDERRSLARDLHDGIGQNLAALKHQLALIANEMGQTHPALLARLESSVGLCAQTLADTRQLSRLLRPQVLDDLGLEAALRWLARTIGESGGIDIVVEAMPMPELDGELKTLLFRVAQEALNNVSRHARAGHAVLGITTSGRSVALSVWDDGDGFDVDAALAQGATGRSSGLSGMRERVSLHGGHLRLESMPGRGSRLMATIPLHGDAGETAP